jgi:hypothetical protein
MGRFWNWVKGKAWPFVHERFLPFTITVLGLAILGFTLALWVIGDKTSDSTVVVELDSDRTLSFVSQRFYIPVNGDKRTDGNRFNDNAGIGRGLYDESQRDDSDLHRGCDATIRHPVWGTTRHRSCPGLDRRVLLPRYQHQVSRG